MVVVLVRVDIYLYNIISGRNRKWLDHKKYKIKSNIIIFYFIFLDILKFFNFYIIEINK